MTRESWVVKNRRENTGEAKSVRDHSEGSILAGEACSAYTSLMAKSHTGTFHRKVTWFNLLITEGEKTKFTL